MAGTIHDVNEALGEPGIRATNLAMMRILKHEFRAPSKMGAPTKYENWMPQAVFEMLSNPHVIFTKKLVCGHLGTNTTTFAVWREKYSDLAEAVAQGIALQESYLASKMADGLKYSQSLYAVLKNLHDWRDKVDETHRFDFRDAMKRAASSAKRVDWDRDSADARTLPVIDAEPAKDQDNTHNVEVPIKPVESANTTAIAIVPTTPAQTDVSTVAPVAKKVDPPAATPLDEALVGGT